MLGLQLSPKRFTINTNTSLGLKPQSQPQPADLKAMKMPKTGDVPGGPVVGTSPSSAGGVRSIPGRGAKIPHASRPKNQNIKQKQYCNKFNKNFKNGPHQKKKILKKNLKRM